jgi:hypothetical protein
VLHRGVVRKYQPDFLIRVGASNVLILETKGKDIEQDQTKRRFLGEWVKAVNLHGGFGSNAAQNRGRRVVRPRRADRFEVQEQMFRTGDDEILTLILIRDSEMLEEWDTKRSPLGRRR